MCVVIISKTTHDDIDDDFDGLPTPKICSAPRSLGVSIPHAILASTLVHMVAGGGKIVYARTATKAAHSTLAFLPAFIIPGLPRSIRGERAEEHTNVICGQAARLISVV